MLKCVVLFVFDVRLLQSYTDVDLRCKIDVLDVRRSWLIQLPGKVSGVIIRAVHDVELTIEHIQQQH
jgi:hypothetical protein